MIRLSRKIISALRARDVTTLHRPGAVLCDDCFFEPPCNFKSITIQHSLHLGAFSYAVSGFLFATRIGRYVSIAEDVQIGRHGHPIEWASTSPYFHRHHRHALDAVVAKAADVKPQQFLLGKRGQKVKITTLGNDVWIGHGAFIVPGVTIGDGAVVGAQAVVTKDVPPYALVAGSPATVRKMRFPDRVIERMQAVRWWRYAFWDLVGASITEPEKFLDTVEKRISEGIAEYLPAIVSLREIAEQNTNPLMKAVAPAYAIVRGLLSRR